jgi:predicted DNA-binding protein
MKDKMFVIRMDHETNNRLIDLADQNNRSRAGVIRDLINQATNNPGPQNQTHQQPDQNSCRPN